MNNENKYPEIIIRKGFGTFSTKGLEFDSSFEITYYPQNTIIETQIDDKFVSIKLFFIQDETWELKGVVNDKYPVNAKNLLRINLEGNQLTFYSFNELIFGQNENSKISFAEFPLVGIYDQKFELEINNWKISSYGKKDELKLIEKKSKNWNLQLEGNIIKIEISDSTEDQFLLKANNITSLLSLAIGNEVVFNRQLYYCDSNLVKEEWRRKVDSHYGVERCIPDFELENFLKLTLTNFENWNDKKRKLFFSTVTYINSSSKGYLEDRLLKISVAWEALAQSWLIKTINPENNDLKPLKDDLKKAIIDSKLPAKYEKELLIDRVSKSLDWEKNTTTLQLFSDQYNLDQEKLELDFKTLNKIRNDIAHTGLFRKKYSEVFLSDLLYNHRFGLQLILLLELGYNANIETQENKWKKTIKIEKILKLNPDMK